MHILQEIRKNLPALDLPPVPPSPSENGCLGCIIEGRTAITTPPKPL